MYSDPNEALSHQYSLFRSVLDSQAPLKKRRVKRQFLPEWFARVSLLSPIFLITF